jgi:PAS domain-containing protein
MCLPYLMEKAASLSDKIVSNTPNGLMVLDNDLNIQLINRPMCRIVGSVSPEAVIGTQVTAILDPFDYLDALQGERVFMKKEYLSEYDKYVENTVVYDEKFNVLICEMRDITKAEQDALKEKEMADKTLAITDEVIERNMKTVHEIASLLGETAAETKVALMALKETIRNEK